MKIDDKDNKINCSDFQEDYECMDNLTIELSYHLDSCAPCQVWQKDADLLSEMALSMPQFDVSENLTQKILTGVESVRQEKQNKLSGAVSLILFGSFIWLLFFHDSVESVWGLASWIIGFASVALLKNLIVDSPKQENMHPSN